MSNRHKWIIHSEKNDINNYEFQTDECDKCGKLRMKTRDQSTGNPAYHYFDSQDDYNSNWYEETAGECK